MAQAGFTLTRDLLRVSKCPQTSPLDIRALAAKGSTTISRLLCLALPRHQLTEAVDIAGCRTRQAVIAAHRRAAHVCHPAQTQRTTVTIASLASTQSCDHAPAVRVTEPQATSELERSPASLARRKQCWAGRQPRLAKNAIRSDALSVPAICVLRGITSPSRSQCHDPRRSPAPPVRQRTSGSAISREPSVVVQARSATSIDRSFVRAGLGDSLPPGPARICRVKVGRAEVRRANASVARSRVATMQMATQGCDAKIPSLQEDMQIGHLTRGSLGPDGDGWGHTDARARTAAGARGLGREFQRAAVPWRPLWRSGLCAGEMREYLAFCACWAHPR